MGVTWRSADIKFSTAGACVVGYRDLCSDGHEAAGEAMTQSDRILQSQLRQSAADPERLIAVAFLPTCAQINWLRPS